jgi:hypothetical protein
MGWSGRAPTPPAREAGWGSKVKDALPFDQRIALRASTGQRQHSNHQ